jgi:hypothetical protein
MSAESLMKGRQSEQASGESRCLRTCKAVVRVAGHVAVHHVQQHMQAQPVRLIYERLQPRMPNTVPRQQTPSATSNPCMPACCMERMKPVPVT